MFLDSDVELAPSDNPTTSTYFASMLRMIILLTDRAYFLWFLEQTKDLSFANDNLISTNLRTTVPISPTRTRLHRDLPKHSNSCSTIYVDDSTVSQPNWKAMIKCVCIAIHSHIVHRKSNKTMNIFDERLHPLTVNIKLIDLYFFSKKKLLFLNLKKDPVPLNYDQQVPEQKTIYRFMRILFTAAQLTAECAIVTLVMKRKRNLVFFHVYIRII